MFFTFMAPGRKSGKNRWDMIVFHVADVRMLCDRVLYVLSFRFFKLAKDYYSKTRFCKGCVNVNVIALYFFF